MSGSRCMTIPNGTAMTSIPGRPRFTASAQLHLKKALLLERKGSCSEAVKDKVVDLVVEIVGKYGNRRALMRLLGVNNKNLNNLGFVSPTRR